MAIFSAEKGGDMNILDRYIGRTVVFGTLTALSVLLALYIFITYIGELQKVGQAQYTPLVALQFTLLSLPRWAGDLFPMAALIGSLMGLGALASNSELTVMRAAGVSVMRITWAVMKVALLMMAIVVIISEGIASHTEQYALKLRAAALDKHISVNTGSGLWIREGNSYINARTVYSNNHLGGVYLYNFDTSKQPIKLTYATEATYQDNGSWILNDVAQTLFTKPYITTRQQNELIWHGILDPGLIDVVAVDPLGLSSRELLRYIDYLESNGLNSDQYRVAFWSKLASPFATGAMMLLAIPFIFGSMRSASMGSRLLAGTLIGIGFYLFNHSLGQLGIVYSIPPFLSATLPTICAVAITSYMLRKTRV